MLAVDLEPDASVLVHRDLTHVRSEHGGALRVHDPDRPHEEATEHALAEVKPLRRHQDLRHPSTREALRLHVQRDLARPEAGDPEPALRVAVRLVEAVVVPEADDRMRHGRAFLVHHVAGDPGRARGARGGGGCGGGRLCRPGLGDLHLHGAGPDDLHVAGLRAPAVRDDLHGVAGDDAAAEEGSVRPADRGGGLGDGGVAADAAGVERDPAQGLDLDAGDGRPAPVLRDADHAALERPHARDPDLDLDARRPADLLQGGPTPLPGVDVDREIPGQRHGRQPECPIRVRRGPDPAEAVGVDRDPRAPDRPPVRAAAGPLERADVGEAEPALAAEEHVPAHRPPPPVRCDERQPLAAGRHGEPSVRSARGARGGLAAPCHRADLDASHGSAVDADDPSRAGSDVTVRRRRRPPGRPAGQPGRRRRGICLSARSATRS